MEKELRNKKVLILVTETQFKKLADTILEEESARIKFRVQRVER